MENGTIPDSKITASSEHTPAKNGRLNFTSGSSWCAGTSDANPYLQIDLQTLHIICAVSTQGNSKADQWVKTYTLKLSIDGSTWTDYKEGGQVKVHSKHMLIFYSSCYSIPDRSGLTVTHSNAHNGHDPAVKRIQDSQLFYIKIHPENRET